jgi:hypothetical protein
MQLPFAFGESQTSHCPVHGVLQQTPSTQKAPNGHAVALVQAAPRGSRGLHVPLSQ